MFWLDARIHKLMRKIFLSSGTIIPLFLICYSVKFKKWGKTKKEQKKNDENKHEQGLSSYNSNDLPYQNNTHWQTCTWHNFPFFPIGYSVSFIEDDMLKKKTLSIRSQRTTDNISTKYFFFTTKANVKNGNQEKECGF